MYLHQKEAAAACPLPNTRTHLHWRRAQLVEGAVAAGGAGGAQLGVAVDVGVPIEAVLPAAISLQHATHRPSQTCIIAEDWHAVQQQPFISSSYQLFISFQDSHSPSTQDWTR